MSWFLWIVISVHLQLYPLDRDYNTGWYHIDGFPQAGGKKMIGKTMFVRINYPDANFYGIKLVKTGYREIMGDN